jgi:DNA-binding HxlR family transcriptional regulator
MSDKTISTFVEAALAPSLDIELAQQPLDKRIIGERNRIGVCRHLFKFGWLTSRMVASLAFEHASQAWPMARRCLKSMMEDGLIMRRAVPQGGAEVYLLTAKGARFLNEQEGLDATSGQGLTLGNPIHRACSNWYLINAINNGWKVITEHEISTDRSPVRVLDGKQVDGILLGDSEAVAIECEHAWKANKPRNAIVTFCARHLGQDKMTLITPDHPLRQMTLVCTNMDALRHIAASFQQAYRDGLITEGQLHMVNVSLLPISRSLVPGEQVDGNLWADVMLPVM